MAERTPVPWRFGFPPAQTQNSYQDAEGGAEAPATCGRLRARDHQGQRAGQAAPAGEEEDGKVSFVGDMRRGVVSSFGGDWRKNPLRLYVSL